MTAPLTDAQIQSLREAANDHETRDCRETWVNLLGAFGPDGISATILALLDEREKARINFAEAVREGLRAVAEVKAERDALRAERDAKEAERAELWRANRELQASIDLEKALTMAAEAEAARLRDALHEISNHSFMLRGEQAYRDYAKYCRNAVKAALTTKGTGE